MNKTFFPFVAVSLVVVTASSFLDDSSEFHAFKQKHNKIYRNQAEEAKRFAIFSDKLKFIKEHNELYKKGQTTWKKGITQFTDWTDEEYKSMLIHQISNIPKIAEAGELESLDQITVPETRDWREEGQVTEVENQGGCDSAYAFSIVGAVEAAYYQKSGQLVPLSEQQILDCSSEVGNMGCSGGFLRETFPVIQWHGIQSNISYPYTGIDEECLYNESAIVTKIDSYKFFYDNQYQLKQVVGNIGPVSAVMDASELSDYKSGIYFSETCSSLNINLPLLIVGYGVENGTTYWIAKNSWGTNWGETGYVRVGYRANYLACGLYRENVYPIIY